MHILTVMDYSSREEIAMCKGWLYLLNRFNPQAHITIFYGERDIEPVRKFSRPLKTPIEFVKLDVTGILRAQDTIGGFPSQHLTLGGWRHVERDPKKYGHFLFIEPDAWVLTSLEPFWKASTEKPYIAVAEIVESNGVPLFNAGVYSYCSQDRFLTYLKIAGQYRLDGRVTVSIGDQGMINAYLRRIKYDARHKLIDGAWNCSAIGIRVDRADDGGIKVMFGPKPDLEKLNMGWMGSWHWWGNEWRDAKIVHAFGRKLWQIPHGAKLWNYVLSKIS